MKWGGGFSDFARGVLESGSAHEEIDRAIHFAWYIVRVEGHAEFSADDLAELFQQAHISRPNTSRLASNLAKSRRTFKGTAAGSFRLTAYALAELDELYGGGLSDENFSPNIAFADDLETQQSVLPNDAVRAFVGEAIGCLRSGASSSGGRTQLDWRSGRHSGTCGPKQLGSVQRRRKSERLIKAGRD
jgi:hypothetical protein